MTEALKPCPFCGGPAILCKPFAGQPYVACENNFCSGPKATEADAIAAWNRRAPYDEGAALAAMQPHERDNFHRVMGQRAVVKRIAEKQIREGE